MKLSVAMATYNGARYIEAQLQSIRQQSRQPDELVISDDASRDDTLGIVRRFAASVPFAVRVLEQPGRLGCNDNFGRAIRGCSGDVIALSDQDDVWLPMHLERLLAPFADDAVGLVISNSDYVDEELKSSGATLWSAGMFTDADVRRIARGPQFREWARHHVVAGHACAFRSKFVDMILPFGHDTYDHWLSILCAACSRVVLINEVLTRHRHHANQAVADREIPLAERVRQQAQVPLSHFESQARDWTDLGDRLRAFDALVTDPQAHRVVADKAALLRRRGAMRQHGHAYRVASAVRELLTGRYHRVGRGWLTFARDLRG